MVREGETTRPTALRVAAALSVLVASVLAFVWLRGRPLIDDDEARDVTRRARRLLGPPRDAAVGRVVVDRACDDGIQGFVLGSHDLTPVPRAERATRCEATGARIDAIAASGEGVLDLEGAFLASAAEMLAERDRERGAWAVAADRALDVLTILARTDHDPYVYVHADEIIAVDDLALSTGGLDDAERELLGRRVATIRARRTSALASIHRAVIEAEDAEAPPPRLDDEAAAVWVRRLVRVEVAERVESLRCGEIPARRCLEELGRLPPPCVAHPRLALLGARFDRCVIAESADERLDYVDAAVEAARSDMAIALLDAVIAHDPRGPACLGGPLPSWEHEGEALEITRESGLLVVRPPWWVRREIGIDPEPLFVLPCVPP